MVSKKVMCLDVSSVWRGVRFFLWYIKSVSVLIDWITD
nr:MAG TPA: hypothetical protein [Caudoviricetes sp.]